MPVEIRELPNGAVLYHILNGSRLCRIEVVMRTGSIHEGNETGCGLSHFLEHMLFQGCARYPGIRAADTIHSLGGECNAYTTFDHTAYYAEVPTEQFAAAADVICSMVAEPLFPEAEFNSEKEVIAREADMIADRPRHAMIQQLWQGLFPNHPAGMPIIGYADKIAGVTRQMMQDYYLRRYGAMRCHFLVTGDINTDTAAEFLSEKLASFTRGNLLETALQTPGNQSFAICRRSVFADPLTRMAVGIRAPEAADKITPALDLLGGIIGGSDSSLLPRELLYGKELALAVDSEFDGCTFGSVLGISAVCEPRNTPALEKNLAQLLKKIRNNGISKAELQREKRQQQLTMYQLLKNTSSTVNLVNSMVMNFNCCDVTRYLDKLNAVTLDEINAAAFEYLDEDRMVWSIVEPADKKKSAAGVKKKKAVPEVYSGRFEDSCQYVIIERSHIPLDSMAVILPAGPVWEKDRHHGISQLLCKMLATGPDDMPEEVFYKYLDSHGIDLDVSCGINSLSIEVSFPPGSGKYAVEILCRLLRSPRRDANVFNRVRKTLAEQLQSKSMEPNFNALMTAKKMVFGNHPGGNSRLETVEDLLAITPEELVEFYHSRLDKKRVNIGATAAPGKQNELNKVLEALKIAADSIPWSAAALETPKMASKSDLEAVDKTEVVFKELPRDQSAVVCAVAGGFAHTREYYALLIMDAALNGLSSNLFREVREKRSLAYSTGGFVNCGLVQGIVALHAGVKPEKAREALECLKNELQRLMEKGLDEDEFTSAQLSALSSLARQMESSDARLLHAQLALFYGDDPAKSLNCAETVRAISRSECNKILSEVLKRSPAACVIAGSAEK